jgi:hypothetical protein
MHVDGSATLEMYDRRDPAACSPEMTTRSNNWHEFYGE